jgi:alpha-1,6-mannosyltransferase
MKVVDLTEYWSERGGGVRSYLTTKAQSMTELGVEHCVLASGPRSEETTLARSAETSSRLLRFAGPALPYDSTYHLFTRLGAVRQKLGAERPDVLEIHSPQLAALAGLAAAKRSFKIRTLVWHSDFIDTHLSWKIAAKSSERAARVLTEPLWAWVRAVARQCSATLVASAWQARKLREHGVPGVKEMPFGIDTRVFKPAARDASYRESFLGSRRAALLVSVGRLAGEKRTDVLIDGFRRLRAKRDALLLIYGDGPERQRLEARAHDLPDVVFMGFERNRAELARALASADALVHAGPFETFGLVVGEARACATPVVVASTGAAGELVSPDCSATYSACDPVAFADAVDRLLKRDPQELCARARDAASQVLSVEQHFRALLGLYSELLGQSVGEG